MGRFIIKKTGIYTLVEADLKLAISYLLDSLAPIDLAKEIIIQQNKFPRE